MNQETASTDIKIIKADYTLQSKVGSGPLDERIVERCQDVMDNNNVDFAPMAEKLLDKLKENTEKLKSGSSSLEEGTQDLRATIMELKANAGTFKYELIGNLANIMLTFLEALRVADDNAIEIVNAHEKTLRMIVVRRMKGDGGQGGLALQKELKAACKRYFDSYK